ncbi:Edrf1 [Symbiodinium sp. KB8]|nr:Edrf1 [Symbiodinium sp. KB8]
MGFRGWVVYGSSVPRFFSCFYPVRGFTMWPCVCIRESKEELEGEYIEEFINHEQIHIAQASEMCCIFMYLLWVFDFLKGLMCIGSRGYQSCACECDARLSYVWNRLEQEAFEHQHDLDYLDERPCCAWWRYPSREGPSLISCEPVACEDFGAKYESISSKVCGWAGELGKDHDLRQGTDCARLFSQPAPFQVSAEFPSSELIPTAQRQPRVDFLSSAAAMKSIFRASFDTESDVGVTVHRLGDWLVIDDGSELSWSPSPGSPENTAWTERVRSAEQQHDECLAKVEAARLKLFDSQQYVEKVRSMLWNAEVAAKQADDELREALAEADQAAAACERLKAQDTAPFFESAEPDGRGDTFMEEDPTQADASYQEDPELYRNFLGHSIRQLQDEPAESESAKHKEREVHTSPACQNGELVLLDSPPASFHQVGIWKIADDASVVVGSRLLCLGNSEHPKLTLYLHDDRVISDTMLLEHWVECLMAGVPEFAICFHRDGAVQSYSLYKVSELQSFLEERMELGRRVQMTLEVLRWIKRQCRLEGCSYWLSKDKKDSALKLMKLPRADATPNSDARPLPLCSSAAAPQGLVLKNTFLDIPDEDSECGDFRRALSCPARFLCETMDDLSHVSPLCGRVSALFFRRAVSSPPSLAAAHFFRQVLDLEAFSTNSGIVWSGAVDETGGPAPDGTGGRAALQAYSHLGLALCELPSFGREEYVSDFSENSASSASAQASSLLAGLRRDIPMAPRGRGRCPHRMLPLWTGAAELEAGCSPLLFVAVPPCPALPSSQGSSPTLLQASCTLALSRTADALSLQLAGEDEKRFNILALPTAALVLLQLASAVMEWSDSCEHGSDRAKTLLWRALMAGQKFAALDAADPPRPQLQPFFTSLPSKEELLVRFEHLCGRALLLFASWHDKARRASPSHGAPEAAAWDELDSQLCRLETWLEVQNSEGKVDAALARLLPDQVDEESRWSLFDGNKACEVHRWRIRASWHLQRSVRLLPPSILEARSQRCCSSLLNVMMMTLATSLSESAAGLLGQAAELGEDATKSSATLLLQALKAANEQLSRAEDLADASGYKAAAALAQASRGHLCALAADWIVDAVRRGAHDPSEQADVIQSLLEEEEEEEELSLSDGQGVMLLVGRLGDQAVAETYAAMRSIDSVVEPDAATVLALMTSGALQAAVDRLRLLPPPDVSEEQRRQVVLDMLGQAVQLLPGEGASAASTVGACVDRQCAMLSAQAHLALSKVHAGLETSSLACHDRQSRQPHKTAPWHLDRVRSALHRASEPVRLEDQTVVTAMLIQVHLLHASFISLGHVPTKKRQHERSLEELLAASRLAASEDGASGVAGDCMLPLRLKTVWKKIKTLVLDQVRHVLRLLCTGKPSSSNEGWKSLYRFALKLEPHQLSELVSAYDKTPI